MIFSLEEFRAGAFSVPYASKDDIHPECFACVYLQVDEATVCFCESYYYFCAYNWPDKLTHSVPPCLEDS